MPGQKTAAGELPFLPERGRMRRRGIPGVQAVQAGGRAGHAGVGRAR